MVGPSSASMLVVALDDPIGIAPDETISPTIPWFQLWTDYVSLP